MLVGFTKSLSSSKKISQYKKKICRYFLEDTSSHIKKVIYLDSGEGAACVFVRHSGIFGTID